jgi:hypothetical protein
MRGKLGLIGFGLGLFWHRAACVWRFLNSRKLALDWLWIGFAFLGVAGV